MPRARDGAGPLFPGHGAISEAQAAYQLGRYPEAVGF